jgi:crotonobetainyl-CoA:carnitine CoA-transferase CaiB-like acyl-CoA transferase
MLQKKGIPAGVVQDAKDLANDPQLRARNFFVNLEHPVLGDTTSERSPVFFRKDAAKNWKPAPLLGADNRYVFCGLLGFTEDRFSAFVEKGIIG